MAKQVHIRVLASGILYYDFSYNGIRSKEYTTRTDMPENRLTNALRKRQGAKAKTLSPRRMNIILTRVRQALDLAYDRGYIEKNPHKWIHLQQERRPRLTPSPLRRKRNSLNICPNRRTVLVRGISGSGISR